MAALEEEIGSLIRQHLLKTGEALTIGSVESATGGRIADKITNVPGSSDYYKGSIISYSNEIKNCIAGVKEETIKTHGAVSPETAIEMAQGGRKILNVDICISDTGIAGPAGAAPEKPVGLFYLGLSAHDTNFTQKHNFQGSRDENKNYAAEAALTILKEYLQTLLNKSDNINHKQTHAVTSFLEHKGKILILRRSQKVGSYQGMWAGVSGYMETSDLDQAYIEIREETGLDKNDIELKIKGDLLQVVDKTLQREWIIHPFLFHVKTPKKINLDWEHIEMKWIKPEELSLYNIVPGLKDVLDRVIKLAGKKQNNPEPE